MEQLLHYVWRHRIFPLTPLCTTAGQAVEVIDPGLPNRDAGPDFFNAKLKIDGTLWVGNVEIHQRSSDWYRHGHDRNPAYNSVVLHVVGEADGEVARADGEALPQLCLQCPEGVRRRYEELSRADALPPCRSVLSSMPRLALHAWMSALQVERLEQKRAAINLRLERNNRHWEDAFFITLARNFGFGLNGDAFEAWAQLMPLRAVDKHRDNLFQVEALFLGMAGLLDDAMVAAPDDYFHRMQQEFRYLHHKFTLPPPLDASRWRFLRLRPAGFPHVRLAQLACLYHHEQSLFSRMLEVSAAEEAAQLFATGTSSYWERHYTFGKESSHRQKHVGVRARHLVVINTVVPFLYAYGMYKNDGSLCERAQLFLEQLEAEDNRIVRQWNEAGLPVRTAADSQALVQLQTAYCERRDCLRCRIGYTYLKCP